MSLPCLAGIWLRPTVCLFYSWDYSMYLLYLDESESASRQHFVIGGLAVHEQNARPLAERAERLSAALPVQVAGRELHAQHIRAGKSGWRRLSKEQRIGVTVQISELLTAPLPYRPGNSRVETPILFAVVLDRNDRHHLDPVERTHEEYFKRFDGMLGRLARAGDYHRGVAIADKSKSERHIQELMSVWRVSGATTGAHIGPMRSYAEVPTFADSEASRLVQLADFVAHRAMRAYEYGDDKVLSSLISSFDSSDGVLHGLVHLVVGHRSCQCVACRSRR